MSTRTYYTVRVTRDDGSVTYKCNRVGLAHAERERDAWTAEGYEAIVVNCANPIYKLDQRAWRRAIIDGHRYFPPEDLTTLAQEMSR